ncbi:MAG TPA: amino acid adenylation domain-containing protein [Candidatus Sulfotelmatobacter sp.]|nr:amino acid adenylation domain-containing protein [Candidatus Sulfotelmatobacter sp.]
MGAEYSDAKRKLLEKYLRGEVGLSPEARPIARRQPGERIPLSHAQEQVWVHAQLTPDLPLYNEPVTIHYSGRLDVSALERSFNEILRRHEAWRTCFVVVDGQPFQEVKDHLAVSLPVVDLRNIPQEQRDATAVAIATADARIPIDLGQTPLFRVRLIRLQDEEHRLYLTLSHIIFDGVAIYRVFLPELAALYKAYSAGEPSPLPELAIQYPDYAIWERRTFTREALAKDMEYWRRKLSGNLPEVYLPTDRPHPRIQTFRGSMYPFRLSGELTRDLRNFCRREGVSLFHALLAAFAALLYRHSGEERIPIGSVTAGRNRPETDAMLGYFLNTVVIPADLSGNPSFRSLIQRARNWTIDTLDHDRVPFEHLVRELRVQRDLNRSPLFQAMFSLEPPMQNVDPAWRLTQMDVDTGATKYDLYLELDERADEVLARFHYSTDLFDLDTVVGLATTWQRLLESALADATQRLSEWSVLSSEEQRRMLVEWNETAAEYPRNLTIHRAFEEQVERTPEATALRCEGRGWTYREINDEANRLGHWLVKQGIGSSSLVGIFLPRSAHAVVALLGALKTGAAYVPLDPMHPPERLRFIIDDAGLSAVITHSSIQAQLPPNTKGVVVLDREKRHLCEPTTNIASAASGDCANPRAYVIYTSGSTGVPKGVEGLHRASMNRFAWMWRTYPFQPGEVCCQKTNIGFVDSIWEIFGPLLAGVCSVIIPQEVSRDPEELLQVLAREHVSRIVLVPSLLGTLLNHAPDLRQRVPDLKLWSCSGEVLPAAMAKRFREAFPEATLLNIYGSSEVAADVTCHEINDQDLTSSAAIGRPISNTQIYLVDEHQNPVPVGMRGQIFVGGDGLARGYLNRPELTGERFIANWLAPERSPRLYRTGDLGRFRSNGEIEYLGRVDGQVKLRGLRIELGEIESVLANHAGVREAVVMVVGEAEQQKLVAYLVLKEDAKSAPSAGELRRYLRTKLPEHMVPASYWQLEALPLLASGKVNRPALMGSDGRALVDHEELATPRNEMERKLAEIWGELLEVKQVGIEQNFFELGGHSLLALQVAARIRRTFEVELPVRSVFEAPTIAGLALEVQKAQALGLKVRTKLPQHSRPAPSADAAQEELLTQLDKLPAQEVRSLLKDLLDGKYNYEFRS